MLVAKKRKNADVSLEKELYKQWQQVVTNSGEESDV